MNYTALIEKYNRLFEAESNIENVLNKPTSHYLYSRCSLY